MTGQKTYLVLDLVHLLVYFVLVVKELLVEGLVDVMLLVTKLDALVLLAKVLEDLEVSLVKG